MRTIVVGRAVPSAPQSQDNADSLNSDYGAAGVRALPPGTHRLTWNADADIAADGEFPRVAVTVKAMRQSVVAAYNRSLSIAVDGYTGAETLTNVPVLVRLSTNITGFAYSDFASPSNGADMAFFDANENKLPYEIDEWHTNGESLVWVKLPTLVKGTKFTCAYGNVDAFVSNASKKVGSSDSESIGRIASTARARMKHEVWAEYAGVWHMNEDSGTAYDSTEHGLDALPSCGTNELADISQMVAYEEGACGRARVNAREKLAQGNYMTIPSYDSLKLAGNFTVSGWIELNEIGYWDALLFRNHLNQVGGVGYHDAKGWCISNGGVDQDQVLYFMGGTNRTLYVKCKTPTLVHNWVSFAGVYDGEACTCYINGEFAESGAIMQVEDNGLPSLLGKSISGQYDEIRLRGGSLSAARIKVDYDMIANRKFCTYGAVKKGAE